MSTSDHSICGPFSLLSETFAGRFDAGIRISGASVVVVVVFGVVTSGLTDGGTSRIFVVFSTDWFTLFVVFSGATFSLIVDSVETKMSKQEHEKVHVK
jgi:hypothetical protein